jgi:hypothetical protein
MDLPANQCKQQMALSLTPFACAWQLKDKLTE